MARFRLRFFQGFQGIIDALEGIEKTIPKKVGKEGAREVRKWEVPLPAVRSGRSREEDERRRARISDAWLTPRGRRIPFEVDVGSVAWVPHHYSKNPSA